MPRKPGVNGFPEEMQGRRDSIMTYVMSDIHGDYRGFMEMLAKIGLGAGDRLYIIGDCADRGPDGVEVLDYALHADNIILIMGNHEDMLLRTLKDGDPRMRNIWMANGGSPTLEGFLQLPTGRRIDLLDRIAALPDDLKISAAGRTWRLVHGSPSDDRESRLWERIEPWRGARPEPDGSMIICGHTPTCLMDLIPERYLARHRNGLEIYACDWFIDVDCGRNVVPGYGRLGCLRLEDMAGFYVT